MLFSANCPRAASRPTYGVESTTLPRNLSTASDVGASFPGSKVTETGLERFASSMRSSSTFWYVKDLKGSSRSLTCSIACLANSPYFGFMQSSSCSLPPVLLDRLSYARQCMVGNGISTVLGHQDPPLL